MGDVKNNQGIVFFDGECIFCNARIDFLMRVDHRRRLLFSPLQGQTAKQMLPPPLVEDLSTISFVHDGTVFTQSGAVLKAMVLAGGFWGGVAKVALLVPRFIRDAVYDFIAENRYRWFGKRDECRMPTPEERERFLT